MPIHFWLVVGRSGHAWLSERAFREMPPQGLVLSEGRIWCDEAAAQMFASYCANQLGSLAVVVCVDVQTAGAHGAGFSTAFGDPSQECGEQERRLTLDQWHEFARHVIPPLRPVRIEAPTSPPLTAERASLDWTRVRGVSCPDTIASAELIKTSVEAVADALAPFARSVERDVFGKRVRFAGQHRIAFRLRGHAWTCLVTCRRAPWAFLDVPTLSLRLSAPVLECSVSDCGNEASISATEAGASEDCCEVGSEDEGRRRYRFRGRDFVGWSMFDVLDPILRAEDAWWDPYISGELFLAGSDRELMQDGDEARFAESLRFRGQDLPVEATAWIAW